MNDEAPACQPPTRSPSPPRVRMAVAEVQMRAAGGPCARRGMLDAGARSRHDVVGTHRSKERLSAAAQRCRAGLVVVSLKDGSHGRKKFRILEHRVLPPHVLAYCSHRRAHVSVGTKRKYTWNRTQTRTDGAASLLQLTTGTTGPITYVNHVHVRCGR